MSGDIMPRRFGLKYEPPTIILEYKMKSKNKLYLHIMPMPELEPNHDPQDWLKILRKEHHRYLDPKLVEEDQIIALIEKLQDNLIMQSGSYEDDDDDNDDDWGF